jgi:hypothetical protein
MTDAKQTKRKLTEAQQDFLRDTEHLVLGGVPFGVATSEYACSAQTGFWKGWVVRTSVATLNGLAMRGYIQIVTKFWRGATVRRIK